MSAINQQSFVEVAFAENLHRGIKRLLRAFRAEHLLVEKLEAAVKEKRNQAILFSKICCH